jgi:hypothetical protein
LMLGEAKDLALSSNYIETPGTLPGAKVHCVRTWPKHMLV